VLRAAVDLLGEFTSSAPEEEHEQGSPASRDPHVNEDIACWSRVPPRVGARTAATAHGDAPPPRLGGTMFDMSVQSIVFVPCTIT
jgi:hypothetical protein